MALEDGGIFCGVAETELAGVSGLCKWPQAVVTWHQRLTLPTLDAPRIQAAFEWVYQHLSANCGLRFQRVDDPKDANIFSESGRGQINDLDGRGGTLAWSGVACGVSASSQMKQMYDEQENWSDQMFRLCALHEVMHALGLRHGPRTSVMSATLNASLKGLTGWDIEELTKRYGRPVTRPPIPTPTPVPPPATSEGTLILEGKRYRVVPVP